MEVFMRINAEKVHEMCRIQSNINTRASLMVAYPNQTGDGNVRVGKRFVNLPADIDMTPGSFYIMCVVDVSRNDKKSVIGQCCFMVEENGELVKSSFCRIDYAYRAVYRTHKASDVLLAHREADAILSWEESMPQDVRLEYLFTTLKNPTFEAYKWKVTTRDIINGQDVGQVDGLRNLWNQLTARQGKSEALINWLNAHPLVTPNTNKVYMAKTSFQQQPQQVLQQPDLQQVRVKKYPNGLPRRYRSYGQDGQQNPPMAQSYMGAPQQQMVPMQVGMPPVGWQQPQMVGYAPQMVPNMAWQQPMTCPQYGMVPQQQFLPQYGWQQQPFVGGSGPVCQQLPVNTYGQSQTAQNAIVDGFSQNPEQNLPKMF